MSLALDELVDVAYSWNDYELILTLSHRGVEHDWAYGHSRVGRRPFWASSFTQDSHTGDVTLSISEQSVPPLTEEMVRDPLHTIRQPISASTRTAISWWMTSKDFGRPLADQFIDLRIALEALYLQDFQNGNSQEMRFRLALFGSWHLGVDFENRKRIRKSFRDAYDTASQAVHSGTLKPDAGEGQSLSQTQDLCRQGILKLLRDGPPRDWGDLVLGGEP